MSAKKKEHSAVAYIDGASRGNPGPASAGVVIQDGAGKEIATVSQRIGHATNNIAEYAGLIFAMQKALSLGLKELEIRTDSELLARQWSGEYKIKEESLKLLNVFVRNLKGYFTSVSVKHVPREQNKLADAQANRALDQELF